MPGLTLVMRWMEGLSSYQFIQSTADVITVRLERGPSFTMSEDDVRRFLNDKIGTEVTWQIEWGKPELTQNGKLLIIRNDWLKRQTQVETVNA